MADQKPWFKLWTNCLTDPDLQNLSLEDWARWVRLGVFIKAHGTHGKITFRAPYLALLDLFKLTDIALLTPILTRFRGVQISDDTESSQIKIEMLNWHKYQVDSSKHRMRKFRGQCDAVEEKRSRGEEKEKRGEENALRIFVDFWKGKTAAERNDKTAEIAEGLKDFKLGFRTSDELFKKIMGEDTKHGTVRSKSISEQAAERKRAQGSEGVRDHTAKEPGRIRQKSAGEIFAGIRNLPPIQPDDAGDTGG